MVQAEAILIDDEADPVIQALEGRSGRLALVSDDVPLIVLGIALRLEVIEDALVLGLRHAVERVEVKEVGVLLVLEEALFAFRQPLGNPKPEKSARSPSITISRESRSRHTFTTCNPS